MSRQAEQPSLRAAEAAEAAELASSLSTVPLYRRLTFKFVAMALLLFMAPQVFLYYFSSNQASEMLIESLRDNLKEKSFLVGADIDRYFDQRLHDVLLLSQADVLEGDNTNATIQYLTEVIEGTPYLDEIDVINIDGTIIASSGEQHDQGENVLRLFPSLRHIFVDVLAAKQGDIFISDVLTLDAGAGLAFLTPVTDDSNLNVIKILLVEINLDTVKKIVADFDDRVIGDKYVYLVDNDGRVIVSADPKTGLLTPYPDLAVQPGLLDNFSNQGDVGSIIYRDAKGEQVMAGYADMAEFGVNKAMDWSIIAVAPLADIQKPVLEFQESLLIITAGIFSMVALVMFLIGRGIIASVMKLLDGANRVGKGDIKFRIELPQNDEFGYLAQTINQTLDKLVFSQEAAENATLTKSEFLAAMSHEIRTPMAGVLGMTDLILERELEPEVLEWTNYIKSSSHNLLKILNEILDQSKLDAGKIEIDPIDFNLVSFVNGIADFFLPSMKAKGIKLDIKIDKRLPEFLCADTLRIGQVLNNLLSNALKFTETGSISLLFDHERINSTEFLMHISVLDTGIGVSKEAQELLFTPFTQADSSTSRNYGVTGLGLSISKQLVELMGGEIGIESVLGLGSKFWFTVVCRAAEAKVIALDKSTSMEGWVASRPLRVLVAEDTAIIQTIIKAHMANLNHEVKIANNGKLAVEYHEAEDFDVILMDVRMPIMDGLEATTIIRSMAGKKSKIPIIALTADVSSANVGIYMEIGMDRVCSKPIDLPDLLTAINELLGEEIHTSNQKAPPENKDCGKENGALPRPRIVQN